MESVEDLDTNRSEVGSSKIGSIGGFSVGGEANADLGNAGEILTRIELDLVCTSEKLCNLNMFRMQVATRESEFEAFDLGEVEGVDMVEKGLEFDLLSGILDSEIGLLDSYMTVLQKEMLDSRVRISSFEHPEEAFLDLEKKLADSEEALEQLKEQLSEIRVQSAYFQETLSRFTGMEKSDLGFGSLPNGGSLDFDLRSGMPTAEQQMHFLRMLEKSLARELDLETKLSETRQAEEELKQRLQSAEQEAFCLEEELFDSWERLFEADNLAEVLMSISKEVLGRLQISQFNLNGLKQRESELQSKLDATLTRLQEKENDLRESEVCKNELEESLFKQKESIMTSFKVEEAEKGAKESKPVAEIANMQNAIDQLKLELLDAVERACTAEAKSNLLEDANKELREDLSLLRSSGLTPERLHSLEKQLNDSDILLQRAVASAEASEEKQSMLFATIIDMENVIEELKQKVSKADNRADSAEDKCIILSETNAELNEELGFLRSKLECLEGSLHLAEEMKLATAKSVGVHTRTISNLMKQLAIERERLNGQLTSLVKENRILVVQLRNDGKYSAVVGEQEGENGGNGEILTPVVDFQEPKPSEVHVGQVDNYHVADDIKVKTENLTAQAETVRRLNVGVLSLKYTLIAGLIFLLITAAYIYSQQSFLFL
ncbi:hypothetical protein MLD38_022566 [Melastoma candidum]|uniref:Uncharacterized protein n=1 Tax=Melastoma candidum TaxID=119954 RepID=A0ACB9QN16_9MYRT|nr:hypothetical protein MLD38_022566 [Melastoma candidum]